MRTIKIDSSFLYNYDIPKDSLVENYEYYMGFQWAPYFLKKGTGKFFRVGPWSHCQEFLNDIVCNVRYSDYLSGYCYGYDLYPPSLSNLKMENMAVAFGLPNVPVADAIKYFVRNELLIATIMKLFFGGPITAWFSRAQSVPWQETSCSDNFCSFYSAQAYLPPKTIWYNNARWSMWMKLMRLVVEQKFDDSCTLALLENPCGETFCNWAKSAEINNDLLPNNTSMFSMPDRVFLGMFESGPHTEKIIAKARSKNSHAVNSGMNLMDLDSMHDQGFNNSCNVASY